MLMEPMLEEKSGMKNNESKLIGSSEKRRAPYELDQNLSVTHILINHTRIQKR